MQKVLFTFDFPPQFPVFVSLFVQLSVIFYMVVRSYAISSFNFTLHTSTIQYDTWVNKILCSKLNTCDVQLLNKFRREGTKREVDFLHNLILLWSIISA
jgi:hypothetical protein